MTQRFERCLRFVLAEEGGFSNDPHDHGGKTHFGVSTPAFESAKARGVIHSARIEDLTPQEAEQCYWSLYWLEPRCYEFPAPLDLLAFDAFVQHRPKAASELMQTAVGAVPDGIFGSKTFDAAAKVDTVSAIERYAYARERLYREIVHADPAQERFLKGWLNRVAHVKAAALAEVS